MTKPLLRRERVFLWQLMKLPLMRARRKCAKRWTRANERDYLRLISLCEKLSLNARLD